ncbi:MAG: GNAT family N-acetyltransferase [Candidatus Nanopelagicales bacterium]|jgi:[ribosomal protein S5]-alanine N-acetyltransferase|nr:GNAT family N-acetyltransferase [Candidatus Nanopelagicales bacterium]MDP4746749.1 GNAT family N-acetyltransferase [Candidatus Nanopelagicales bacterium]
MAPFWPVVLQNDNLVLRPLKLRDKKEWTKLRQRNQNWFQQWESTVPDEFSDGKASFYQIVKNLRVEAKAQRSLPFVMEIDKKIAGQITVANINYGSTRSAYIGYWIAEEFAGKGYTPLAVAMAIDHCFQILNLHRIEITIRPENLKSLRVVEKLGLRSEGLRPKYLHIDGDWRDHLVFAINKDEYNESLVLKMKNLK